MKEALARRPGEPVEVEDEETQDVYLLIPRDELQQWRREALLKELQIGFDQADAGEFFEWDPDEIKAEGRRRLKASRPD
jgi:hypothetical protein